MKAKNLKLKKQKSNDEVIFRIRNFYLKMINVTNKENHLSQITSICKNTIPDLLLCRIQIIIFINVIIIYQLDLIILINLFFLLDFIDEVMNLVRKENLNTKILLKKIQITMIHLMLSILKLNKNYEQS